LHLFPAANQLTAAILRENYLVAANAAKIFFSNPVAHIIDMVNLN
jgi:hypothetical protein